MAKRHNSVARFTEILSSELDDVFKTGGHSWLYEMTKASQLSRLAGAAAVQYLFDKLFLPR